jgi:PAS domain S-box-containing protein
MKIQVKLLLLILAKTTFTMIIALLVTTYLTREALESAAKEKLTVVMEGRYNELTRWTHQLQAQIIALATANTTVKALRELSPEFTRLGGNAQTLLQQNYLALQRPYQVPSAALPTAIIPYDNILNSVTSYFTRRHNIHGWDDMFLIDTQGNVVFSVDKEPDFATNLRTGPWKNSGLARAVLPLLQNAIPGQLGFADYSRYQPSKMRAASFIAMPVFDEGKQEFLGVVAIQLPVSQVNELMLDKSGMGETGEVIIVGKDGWMLSDSRFSKETTILKKQIKSKPAEVVLAGKTDTLIAQDSRGIDILAMVKPFTPFPTALGEPARWGIIAKIEHHEVLSSYYNLLRVFLLTTVGLILLAVSLGVWGGRTITRPLVRITDALTRLAKGEQINIPELNRRDEIGAIAKSAETFHNIVQQIEQEHWLSENVNILTSAVSVENNLEKAAERVLYLLCNLLNVPVGTIYLLNGGHYQRVSAHGLARSSQCETCFERGVGILGQCAQNHQAMVISPVPAGLTIISTGLAEFPPQELILYPIEHKNEVLAVLELAATQTLLPKHHAFLKAAASSLGLHFANLQAAEHNAQLLLETSQQAAELRISSGYARSLIEASLDPLVTIGVDGKIMDVNAATEKVTGVAREQLIGSDFCDYFTDPEQARSGYQQVFSQGFVTDYALAIRHRNGKITDVVYNASIYRDIEGKVAGIFAAARDITEKKLAEQKMLEQQESLLRSNTEMQTIAEELRSQSEEMQSQNEELKANQEELRAQQEETLLKNQQLEAQSRQLEQVIAEAKAKATELLRTNQYKSEFLANMSHELRTPLNSILILSKNLAENEEKNLNPDQVESASVISESGTQLLTLINDILDLSKIEAGKLEIIKESFALNEMVAYLRRVFSPQAERKNLNFTLQIDEAVPEHLYTDKQRLTQILSNLLTNAIKFTDSGTVGLVVSKTENDIVFNITDTGLGIPADKLEHIFGAFQQLDGSTSRKYGGSGLGLAISRQLAQLLDGKIIVSSVVGKGSSFAVQLHSPFNRETTVQASAPPAPQELPVNPSTVETSGGNILLVEDDTRLLAILGRMITALGFTPIAVESAELALQELAAKKVAGIFLDLGLPKMSGMEFLRHIKANPAMAQTPVFIMSGATDTGEAKTLGALGFLKKPVTRDTIVEALKTMLHVSHNTKQPVLLIEDNTTDKNFVEQLLKNDPIDLISAETGQQALQLLSTQHFAAVILDLRLPDTSGFDWLKQARQHLTLPPVIVYSARELTENEVFELKAVAESIVTKDALSSRLREELLHALHTSPIPVALSSGQSTGKKLLLVDDDARNLYALTKVLKAKGFKVEVAPDSHKALELLAHTEFDVLLTDIMMPEVDGYELIRWVRTLGYEKLPIIAITAKAMQADQALCLEAGATAYLAKPVDVQALIELLNKLI